MSLTLTYVIFGRDFKYSANDKKYFSRFMFIIETMSISLSVAQNTYNHFITNQSIIKPNFWFSPTLLQPMHCIESSNTVVICTLYCSVLAVVDDLAVSYSFFNIFGIKYCTL